MTLLNETGCANIASVLCAFQPVLNKDRASHVANVIVQIMKGMSLLFIYQAATDHEPMAAEFRLLLNASRNKKLHNEFEVKGRSSI